MNAIESRSRQSMENLQELMDANGGKGDASLEQYFTSGILAYELAGYLPTRSPSTVFDPQVGSGNLVKCIANAYPSRFGIEIDTANAPGGVNTIEANCMKVFDIIEELMPSLRFNVANANPPFGRKWKTKDGQHIDSTLATWQFVTTHAECGYFITNANTAEKMGIHQSTKNIVVTRYERRDAAQYWPGLRAGFQIGIIVWRTVENQNVTPAYVVTQLWENIKKIVEEERQSRPKFNIWLNSAGYLDTYLSQRTSFKLKLTPEQIKRLHTVKGSHPLALTTEKETRVLMRELIDCGLYTIQPEALTAIEDALADVNRVSCPIMPANDFECVSYTEEEEALYCIQSCTEIGAVQVQLTAGKTYPLTTGSYEFTENFKRNKVHFNEETKETFTKNHDCVLSGTDRYIQIVDDQGRVIKFMDRPRELFKTELPESALWDYFKRPNVPTVAEVCAEHVHTHHAVMRACEMLAGYQYYAGQLEYLPRVAVKDCAFVAAETGVGKSLMAISLVALKSPKRALLIAPQGTMRSSKSDEDEDEEQDGPPEMSVSQWVKELNKFAPYIQVFEIFSYADYQQILAMNQGQLPFGLYVTYYEAMFLNGAKERSPLSWDDEKLNAQLKVRGIPAIELEPKDKHKWCDTIGKEVEGIRCVLEPCLSTLIGDKFDMVIVDEAHRAKGLNSLTCQMLIRLQPKYRYCLSATPVSNTVQDVFPLMGWLAVPDWYKGNRRNAAWPYAREELGRFCSTFLTQERDLTQEDDNRRADPKNRSKCIKDSPIISSPARLLKLLKPNMAFISKEQCSKTYIKPRIIDVRVPLGREQAELYGHFTNRSNINASNPLVRARKQTAYLRNICADPAGFAHGGPKVSSNFNPKVIAILELCRDILAHGEQVVIINSRVGLTSTILSRLADAGVSIARIDSTMTAEQHARQANLFKLGRARVLGMGIKCAAAYSFDNCDNLIIGSLEYASGVFVQACGRIDRITNKKVKNIYCILNRNSMEEVMFETVSIKNDAANLCLRGVRVPREFKPVDASEILAKALDRFTLDGATPESTCENQWPKLRQSITAAINRISV